MKKEATCNPWLWAMENMLKEKQEQRKKEFAKRWAWVMWLSVAVAFILSAT